MTLSINVKLKWLINPVVENLKISDEKIFLESKIKSVFLSSPQFENYNDPCVTVKWPTDDNTNEYSFLSCRLKKTKKGEIELMDENFDALKLKIKHIKQLRANFEVVSLDKIPEEQNELIDIPVDARGKKIIADKTYFLILETAKIDKITTFVAYLV